MQYSKRKLIFILLASLAIGTAAVGFGQGVLHAEGFEHGDDDGNALWSRHHDRSSHQFFGGDDHGSRQKDGWSSASNAKAGHDEDCDDDEDCGGPATLMQAPNRTAADPAKTGMTRPNPLMAPGARPSVQIN